MQYYKSKFINKILISILISFGFVVFVDIVYASSTSGTIDSTNRYAYGENIGWIDFGATNSGVSISDSALSGYAWGENIGWISLNCSNDSSCATVDYGIDNDGNGNLSGYAWGENVGWIDFDPSGSGVVINSSGEFTGYAWGENIGWINFNCVNDSSCGTVDFKVSTDYRPQSARAVCNNSSDDDGDGKIDYPNDPGCDSLTDTDETDPVVAETTNIGGGGIPGSVGVGGAYVPVSRLQTMFPDGTVVYLSEKVAEVTKAVESVAETVKAPIISIVESVAEIFKPEVEEVVTPETEKIVEVPKEAQFVFQRQTNLISSKKLESFVFAPLPKEVALLQKQFPEVGKMFGDLGIDKLSDINKLKDISLRMPGITESSGLKYSSVKANGFLVPSGIPVAKLTDEAKGRLPKEVVFAKSGGELIDLHNFVTVSERGNVSQKITATAGKTLDLFVKPQAPVTSVKGYFVLKSKSDLSENDFSIPTDSLLGAIFFSTKPVFAKESEPIEKEMVLMEFDYKDYDGDGIYSAKIQAPVVEGEYEIITVMKYKDITIGDREVRMIAVIDPEGYVYEGYGDKEIRIPNAIVSIYWKDLKTGEFILWPADEYLQTNPQKTDKTGKYSFLVPEGVYRIEAKADGYLDYNSNEFITREGDGVHMNIELKKRSLSGRISGWFSKIFTFWRR